MEGGAVGGADGVVFVEDEGFDFYGEFGLAGSGGGNAEGWAEWEREGDESRDCGVGEEGGWFVEGVCEEETGGGEVGCQRH